MKFERDDAPKERRECSDDSRATVTLVNVFYLVPSNDHGEISRF